MLNTSMTFKNGKFVLALAGGSAVIPGPRWQWVASNIFKTSDLYSARKFWFNADEKALQVLDRAFVKYYNLAANIPKWLDPHQVRGVEWMLSRSRSYAAHCAGAGKTPQAIVGSMLSRGEGQTLFIVPPSLIINWAREVEKFWAMMISCKKHWPKIAVVPESDKQEFMGWNADFVIVPDSMISRPWVLDKLITMKKKFVAVDEASRFKEPTAQRSIILFGGTLPDGRKSPGLVYDSRHAVLLDGSPMPNRPMELWGPTYAMSPESIDFMTQQDFGFKYCGATQNEYGQWAFRHSSNEAELKTRLQKTFMHVVLESELNHPERRRSMLFMSHDVRSAEHKAWEKENLKKLTFADINEDMSQGDLAKFRRELGLRKVPWVAAYVTERLQEKDESILLFAWHRDVVQNLAHNLRKFSPRVVMGGDNVGDREDSFAEFQAGKCKLIIGNIAAMGRGNNLQRGDRVIFAEWSWGNETNTQAEKRVSRRGNEKAFMRSEYIVCPNTLDEVTLTAVFKGSERVRKVIG